MFGSSRFKWVQGPYNQISMKTPATLALSDADPDVGTVKRGKPVKRDDSDLETIDYGDNTTFLGMLLYEINDEGTTGLQGFQDFTVGKQDIPKKRGSAVPVRVPLPGAIAEFEGTGTAIIDNLVADSGTGEELSAGTAQYSELTLNNGCWVLAAAVSSDIVYARLLDPTLTPENGGELRILVEFVSPYPKA